MKLHQPWLAIAVAGAFVALVLAGAYAPSGAGALTQQAARTGTSWTPDGSGDAQWRTQDWDLSTGDHTLVAWATVKRDATFMFEIAAVTWADQRDPNRDSASGVMVYDTRGETQPVVLFRGGTQGHMASFTAVHPDATCCTAARLPVVPQRHGEAFAGHTRWGGSVTADNTIVVVAIGANMPRTVVSIAASAPDDGWTFPLAPFQFFMADEAALRWLPRGNEPGHAVVAAPGAPPVVLASPDTVAWSSPDHPQVAFVRATPKDAAGSWRVGHAGSNFLAGSLGDSGTYRVVAPGSLDVVVQHETPSDGQPVVGVLAGPWPLPVTTPAFAPLRVHPAG